MIRNRQSWLCSKLINMNERSEEAQRLRREGYSIKEISRTVNAAQSSVSLWVRNVSLTHAQRLRLHAKTHAPEVIEKRRVARLENEAKKRQFHIDRASNEVGNLTRREVWLIGTALYWAEGGKTQRTVRFSNGDPRAILIMLTYFRDVCEVKEDKLRVHIHIHESLDAIAAEKYWSKITKIPRTRFYKTYCKPNSSSKNLRNTLPYGVCDIYVSDVKLFLKIQGWIRGIYDAIN